MTEAASSSKTQVPSYQIRCNISQDYQFGEIKLWSANLLAGQMVACLLGQQHFYSPTIIQGAVRKQQLLCFISLHAAATMAINTRPVKSFNIHTNLLVVTTDGDTTVDSKVKEIDVISKQWAQIKYLMSKGEMLIKICLKYMVKLLFGDGEEAENYVTNPCTAVMSGNIHQVDKLTHSEHHTTRDKLCFTSSIRNNSIMATAEELHCSSLCMMGPWMLNDAHKEARITATNFYAHSHSCIKPPLISSCPFVLLLTCITYHWTDLGHILQWGPPWKSDEKFQTWLKSGKNTKHFAWRPKYVRH